MSRIIKIWLCIIITILFSSCAATHFENMELGDQTTTIEEEQDLWAIVALAQKKILDSDFIYDDEVLTEYVNGVLLKVSQAVAGDIPVDLNVYIVQDPNFNALAYPNGVIFVHTGLLAHVDNEAQLATILAHELTHVLHRHLLKDRNHKINTTTFLSFAQIASVGVSAGLAYGGYDVNGVNLIQHYVGFGGLATIYGYSRGLEKEADEYGFTWMRKAGYDPKESKVIFQNLYAISKEEGKRNLIPYFYQSHPKIKKRIKTFEVLIQDLDSEALQGVVNKKIYMNHVKILLLDNAFTDVKRNKISWAQRQLDKYNRYFAENTKSLYLKAKILLSKNKEDEAIQILVKANRLNKKNADVIKDLGLLHYKRGEKDIASMWFKKFLALNPDSIDADFIKGYLNE